MQVVGEANRLYHKRLEYHRIRIAMRFENPPPEPLASAPGAPAGASRRGEDGRGDVLAVDRNGARGADRTASQAGRHRGLSRGAARRSGPRLALMLFG